MGQVEIPKNDLKIMRWLCLPMCLATVLFGMIIGAGQWWVYFFVLIMSWYVYTLFSWRMYQKYVLNHSNKIAFYFSLIVYQSVVVAGVFMYALTL